jgi:hypothetical protein
MTLVLYIFADSIARVISKLIFHSKPDSRIRDLEQGH